MLTFDPAKRDWTFRIRALRFEDAGDVFRESVATFEDVRRDYGERRFVTVGGWRQVDDRGLDAARERRGNEVLRLNEVLRDWLKSRAA